MNNQHGSNFHRTNVDPALLSRSLTIGFLFVMSVVASFYVIKTGNRLFMAGLVALPFVLMLMNMPTQVLVLALLLDATLLPVPGLASSTLGYLAKFILAATYTLAILMGRRQWVQQRTLSSKMVWCYLIWLIVLIAVRGSGLRILGSTTWGGTRYIAHFVSIFMFFALNGMRIEMKYIRWIVYGSLIAGLIGAVFMGLGYSAGAEEASEASKARLSFLRPFFVSFFPLIMALQFKRKGVLRVVFLIISLLLVAATGFRSFLVGAVMILAGFGFFKARNKVGFTVSAVSLGLVAWVAIIFFSPMLPPGMQRAISFVPGAQIDAAMAMDASGSIEWRLDVWKYCLEQSKDYLLVGRGMAFDVRQVLEETSQSDIWNFTPWFAYQMHAYHSGPLALLIDLGIPGMIIYIIFSVYAFKLFWRYAARLAKLDSIEARFALFQCVSILWSIFAFYAVFGGIQRIAEQIFLYAVVTIYAESVLWNAKEEKEKLQMIEELPQHDG
jgi:hypothetical protein